MSLQEIKSERLEEEFEGFHEELNDLRAKDISNICLDYEDQIPIKDEIKEEIKSEPLDEDNVDVETHSCDDDHEKSDLQAMVDKLLIENQTLQKDRGKFLELQVENENLRSESNDLQIELEKLQVINQNLTSEKNYVERQLEDKEKKFQELKKNAKLKKKILQERPYDRSNRGGCGKNDKFGFLIWPCANCRDKKQFGGEGKPKKCLRL